jgi:hypothetical protein
MSFEKGEFDRPFFYPQEIAAGAALWGARHH